MRTWMQVGAVMAAITITVAGCGSDDGDVTTTEGATTPSAEVTTPLVEETSTDEAGDPTEDSTAEPTDDPTTATGETPVIEDGDLPVWAFPASVEGWQLTAVDQNGINQLTRESCRFTTSQNYHPSDPEQPDVEASTDLAETIAASLEESADEFEVAYSRDSVPTGFPDLGPTEMIRIDMAYSAGGADYQTVMLARTFTERDSWVSLQYACAVEDFDEGEYEDLRDRAALQYVEPSSL